MMWKTVKFVAAVSGAAMAVAIAGPLAAQDAARAALSAPASTAPATRPAGKLEIKGPLAGLPSAAAGPHVERVKGLGDDQWVNLGSPAADPVWGRRRGASWTPRMAYAGELRAALVTGAGNHDDAHRRGGDLHFDDDIFAYDINAHRWVCAYPGANCRTLNLKLDERGFEVDEQGRSVPVAFIGHGYNLYTYNPDWHQLVCMPLFAFGAKPMPQRAKWLGNPSKLNRNPKHPVFYDVSTGRLERVFVEGTGPGRTYWGRHFFEGFVEYLPSRKQAFFLYFGEVWLYDFAQNAWVDPKTPGTPNNWGYDCTGCFDTRRERVYSGKGKTFIYYDVKTNAWSSPETSRPPVELGGGVRETMTYDSLNDVIVLNTYNHPSADTRGLFFFSPAEGKWLSDKPQALPDDYARGQRNSHANAFYDPEFNAHYFFMASDSQDNGVMWVYRYRSAKKQT
jgi:hypothetical protein